MEEQKLKKEIRSVILATCPAFAQHESKLQVQTNSVYMRLEKEGFPNWTLNAQGELMFQIVTVSKEAVNHPSHYGGEDNPYEAIKVIEALDFGFNLGNCFKYIARAGKKGAPQKHLEDLKKAAWYLNREIQKVEGK